MKKKACILTLAFLTFLLYGCNEFNASYEQKELNDNTVIPTYLAGWIAINNETLYINKAKVYMLEHDYIDPFFRYIGENFTIIDLEEADRLGIDMSGGIKISSLDRILSFQITDQTAFYFMDTALLFVSEHYANLGIRAYSTTNTYDFLLHRANQGTGVTDFYCRFDLDRVMTPSEFLLRSSCECSQYRLRTPIVFVHVYDGQVVSVIEEFLFTQ